MTTETEPGNFPPTEMVNERTSELLLQSHDIHENEKGATSLIAEDVPEAINIAEPLHVTDEASKQQEDPQDPIAEQDTTEIIPIVKTPIDRPAEVQVIQETLTAAPGVLESVTGEELANEKAPSVDGVENVPVAEAEEHGCSIPESQELDKTPHREDESIVGTVGNPAEATEGLQVSEGTLDESHIAESSAESVALSSIPTIKSDFDTTGLHLEHDASMGTIGTMDDEILEATAAPEAGFNQESAQKVNEQLPEPALTVAHGVEEPAPGDSVDIKADDDAPGEDSGLQSHDVPIHEVTEESGERKEEDASDKVGNDAVLRLSQAESELESLDTIPSEVTITPSEEQPPLSRLESIKTEESRPTSAITDDTSSEANDTVVIQDEAPAVEEEAPLVDTVFTEAAVEIPESVEDAIPTSTLNLMETGDEDIHEDDHTSVAPSEPDTDVLPVSIAGLDHAAGIVEAALQEDDLHHGLGVVDDEILLTGTEERLEDSVQVNEIVNHEEPEDVIAPIVAVSEEDHAEDPPQSISNGASSNETEVGLPPTSPSEAELATPVGANHQDQGVTEDLIQSELPVAVQSQVEDEITPLDAAEATVPTEAKQEEAPSESPEEVPSAHNEDTEERDADSIGQPDITTGEADKEVIIEPAEQELPATSQEVPGTSQTVLSEEVGETLIPIEDVAGVDPEPVEPQAESDPADVVHESEHKESEDVVVYNSAEVIEEAAPPESEAAHEETLPIPVDVESSVEAAAEEHKVDSEETVENEGALETDKLEPEIQHVDAAATEQIAEEVTAEEPSTKETAAEDKDAAPETIPEPVSNNVSKESESEAVEQVEQPTLATKELDELVPVEEAVQPEPSDVDDAALTPIAQNNIAEISEGLEGQQQFEADATEDSLPAVDAPLTGDDVPVVDVEAGTPGAETNPLDVDEDIDPNTPLEQRLAEAVGIPPENLVSLPALSKDAAASIPGSNAPVIEEEVKTPVQVEESQQIDGEQETITGEQEESQLEVSEPLARSVSPGLAVDTSVSVPTDRPKSPWTPSYSVTTQGPGISDQESAQLLEDEMEESATKLEDSDSLQDKIDEVQSPPIIQTEDSIIHDSPERPKSPYPPSYSVTQMGNSPRSPAAMVTLEPEITADTLPLNLENLDLLPNESSQGSEQSKGIEAASHVPEASSSPRSSLGALTPFDSRSEVSEASHEPIAASTPRSEPDTLSTVSQTPLVTSTVLQHESSSVERTPLVSTAHVADTDEDAIASEDQGLILPSPMADSLTGEKQADDLVSDEDETFNKENLSTVGTQESEELLNASGALDIQVEPVQHASEEAKDATDSEPILDPVQTINNGKSAIKDTQPIAVTTTFSKDSAYTQATDDTFASNLTEDTNITTPDVETLVMPKLHTDFATEEAGSTDVFDEATIKQISPGPASAVESVRSINRQSTGNIAAVGIGHDLTKTFPPAFPTSAGPSSEQLPNTDDTIEESEIGLAAPRRRLQSTASSLHFPGGWVTSPKGDRPSLEIATGEFSRPQLEGGPASAVLSPVKEERKADGGDKWRCVIM